MKEELRDFVADLIETAAGNDLILDDEKDINYGIKLIFRRQNDQIPINVYCNKKGQISTVVTAKKVNPLYSTIYSILADVIYSSQLKHGWTTWIGTDESGKGDLFGPLVACGFLTDKRINPKLMELSVRDSKKIATDKIHEIAEKLLKNYRNRIEIIVLEPAKYNELYEKFLKQNKKLNELLAWMHARIILNMNKKRKFDGAIVDKFAPVSVLQKSIKDLRNLSVLAFEKGEIDPAVAAASIIARHFFLMGLENLSDKYKIRLPRGSGKEADKILEDYINKYGSSTLNKIAKLNFKNVKKVKGLL